MNVGINVRIDLQNSYLHLNFIGIIISYTRINVRHGDHLKIFMKATYIVSLDVYFNFVYIIKDISIYHAPDDVKKRAKIFKVNDYLVFNMSKDTI